MEYFNDLDWRELCWGLCDTEEGCAVFEISVQFLFVIALNLWKYYLLPLQILAPPACRYEGTGSRFVGSQFISRFDFQVKFSTTRILCWLVCQHICACLDSSWLRGYGMAHDFDDTEIRRVRTPSLHFTLLQIELFNISIMKWMKLKYTNRSIKGK